MSNGHPYEDADYDLYALGALRGEENAAIESHVASCDECAHKLAEARGRIGLLAFAADPREPSPGVKESILRQLFATAEGEEYSRERQRHAPRRLGRYGFNWWTAIWAPAAIVLACASIFLWIANVNMHREIGQMYHEVSDYQSGIAESQAKLELFSAKDSVRVNLAPMKEYRGTNATVLYNARLGKAFYSDTLSTPPPPDKSYQLWLVGSDGNPTSAGLLAPGEGQGTKMFASFPKGIECKAFAVTIEPAGGSEKPTGPKILIGTT
jgi:anti-sigma-K factor RskA